MQYKASQVGSTTCAECSTVRASSHTTRAANVNTTARSMLERGISARSNDR
jgi:hypothetical protein